jgi:uncharacterized protein (TIGR02677 family)
MQRTWWKRIEPRLWRFASLPGEAERELYAALLGALLVASTRMPMATLADLRVLLGDVGYRDPHSDEELRHALDLLVQQNLAKPFKDYTAVVADYRDALRRQEAWSLSTRGRVVVRAVRDAVTDLDRSLQLPPRLLDAVETTVRTLLEHLYDDPDLLVTDLAQVRTHLEQLQTATGDFYEAVAALVQHDVTDDSVFSVNRERILLALQQFARQTQRSLQRVRRALADLAEEGHAVVVERALPGANVLDADRQQAWVGEMRQLLDGLGTWFAPRGSVDRLIESAAGAIHTLLGAIERRFHASSRGSDLGADFRQLARMLHAQPSDQAAHQVFAAALGLWPARHPRRPDAEDIAAAAMAADGTRCRVQVTLRPTERGAASAGRPRKLADVAADRDAAEAGAVAELVRLAGLAADLVTPGPVALTHFAGLDAEHTGLLARLLEGALDAFNPSSGSGTAAMLQCELELWPGQPGRTVTVSLAEGTLIVPDLRVAVHRLGEKGAATVADTDGDGIGAAAAANGEVA